MPLSTLKIQFYKIAFFNRKSSSLKILYFYLILFLKHFFGGQSAHKKGLF